MKRIHWIHIGMIVFFVCSFSFSTVQSKTLYDSFSGTTIDPQKWNDYELVREVVNGKLLSKVGNSANVDDVRNNTPFQNPGSITVIECEITVFQAVLDTGTNLQSVARMDGRFYNTLNEGTEKGDIWAAVSIGDQGSGIEAWWEVWEATDDNGDSWEEKGGGTLDVPGLAYGQAYQVKIDYDGNNNFTFTVHGVDGFLTGPARLAAENVSYKALETVVSSDGGAGNGFVSASFDDVHVNDQGSAYDDFSISPLDQTNWQDLEFVREVDNGKLRLTAHSDGEREQSRVGFPQIDPYIEAKITIKSNSTIASGDRGIARIDGYIYNDTYGPGNYVGYTGNVWAAIDINYYGDGTLAAKCYGSKALNADDTESEDLFGRTFNLPIILDRAYKLSIHFDGSRLIFTCKDTVTGRMDVSVYNIETSIYEPFDAFRALRSRVYGSSTGGYMAVDFDDVYVDVAEPAATYDANGDWEITTSNSWALGGCDLPDDGEKSDATITQNGNDLTLVVHDENDGDITLTGFVYGDTYAADEREEENGETNIVYTIFALSENTSGSGNVSIIWFDNDDYCEMGFDISLVKPSTGGDGGGGGGGCFIEALIH